MPSSSTTRGYRRSHSMYIGAIELAKDCIHELILSTWLDGSAYAAPIGVRVSRSNALVARVFRGSRLWRACAENDAIALNVCLDPAPFIYSILDKTRLEFDESEALSLPVLRDCEGYIECLKIGSVDLGDTQLVYLQPINAVVRKLRPYTRALGLSIEILIELTRLRARVRSCAEVARLVIELLPRVERVYGGEALSLLKGGFREVCG